MKASIIILAYNQIEETTRPCIESIYKNTCIDDFELIVVDNNSTDSTLDYLKELEKKKNNIRIVCNKINKGYAAGNNDAIKIARGDVIILLNSDTLVSDGWLDELLYPFSRDKKIGLVGPVTNSVGNEQIVFISDISDKNYEILSRNHLLGKRNKYFNTKRLGFFCVAIKKEVIDSIGLLDESFGIGTFEDDDYCLRAIGSGFLLAISEGSFIYHKGSASFEKFLTSGERKFLFKKNLDLFDKKWGICWSLIDNVYIKCNAIKNNIGANEIEKRDLLNKIDNILKDLQIFREMEIDYRRDNLELKNTILMMEGSKFWKLRNFYLTIRGIIVKKIIN